MDFIINYDSLLYSLLLISDFNAIEPFNIAFSLTYNLFDAYFTLRGKKGIKKSFIWGY